MCMYKKKCSSVELLLGLRNRNSAFHMLQAHKVYEYVRTQEHGSNGLRFLDHYFKLYLFDVVQ